MNSKIIVMDCVRSEPSFQMQGCFRNHNRTTANEVQLCRSIEKLAPSMDARENAILITGSTEDKFSSRCGGM